MDIVVKLFTTSSGFPAVEYNMDKVERGDAELLLYKNFGIIEAFISPQAADFQHYLGAYSSLGTRSWYKQFHAVLSVKGKSLSSESLKNFVLKPLFSFAGSGVNLNPTREITDSIEDKENYILQRKVVYEPIFEDIDGEFSKAEIRLLYIWREQDARPILLENLGRMTKAAMVNVDFNKKDAIWIGSSNTFFAD